MEEEGFGRWMEEGGYIIEDGGLRMRGWGSWIEDGELRLEGDNGGFYHATPTSNTNILGHPL